MTNQTSTTKSIAKAFQTFEGTFEERGSRLAKLEKTRVTSLEKAHRLDIQAEGLAYQIGQLIHELTQESENGRISSERLSETSMNRVASQRRSEALQYYRKFPEIQLWLNNRVAIKKKQAIAFTSITAMLKAFKFETQPKAEPTSTKVDDNPNVGTTQPKAEPTDTKVSDTKPPELKVQKVQIPQNSKEFAEYVFKLSTKLGFDRDEVLEHIFNMFNAQTFTSKTGTNNSGLDLPF